MTTQEYIDKLIEESGSFLKGSPATTNFSDTFSSNVELLLYDENNDTYLSTIVSSFIEPDSRTRTTTFHTFQEGQVNLSNDRLDALDVRTNKLILDSKCAFNKNKIELLHSPFLSTSNDKVDECTFISFYPNSDDFFIRFYPFGTKDAANKKRKFYNWMVNCKEKCLQRYTTEELESQVSLDGDKDINADSLVSIFGDSFVEIDLDNMNYNLFRKTKFHGVEETIEDIVLTSEERDEFNRILPKKIRYNANVSENNFTPEATLDGDDFELSFLGNIDFDCQRKNIFTNLNVSGFFSLISILLKNISLYKDYNDKEEIDANIDITIASGSIINPSGSHFTLSFNIPKFLEVDLEPIQLPSQQMPSLEFKLTPISEFTFNQSTGSNIALYKDIFRGTKDLDRIKEEKEHSEIIAYSALSGDKEDILQKINNILYN